MSAGATSPMLGRLLLLAALAGGCSDGLDPSKVESSPSESDASQTSHETDKKQWTRACSMTVTASVVWPFQATQTFTVQMSATSGTRFYARQDAQDKLTGCVTCW
jgi:cytochrome c553